MKRRNFMVSAAMSFMIPALVRASDWPDQNIHIVVPFPPGGSTDILGRAVADYIHRSLGATVIVDNIPGATGMIGTATAARAKPDGYTLLMGSIGTMVTNHFANDNLSFSMDSFDPIINIAETPNVVMVRPDLDVSTVQELIDLMKKNPGKLNYGTPGIASSAHVSTELFMQRTGVTAEHVPYKGSSPMLVDLIGGFIDFSIDNISSSLELIKGGKIKAIAVTSENRSPLLPDLPTVIEAGIPGYVMAPWFSVAAPANTPSSVIQKLNVVLNDMLKDAKVRDLLISYGAEPVGGSPEEIAALMVTEAAKIRDLSATVNFKTS